MIIILQVFFSILNHSLFFLILSIYVSSGNRDFFFSKHSSGKTSQQNKYGFLQPLLSTSQKRWVLFVFEGNKIYWEFPGWGHGSLKLCWNGFISVAMCTGCYVEEHIYCRHDERLRQETWWKHHEKIVSTLRSASVRPSMSLSLSGIQIPNVFAFMMSN